MYICILLLVSCLDFCISPELASLAQDLCKRLGTRQFYYGIGLLRQDKAFSSTVHVFPFTAHRPRSRHYITAHAEKLLVVGSCFRTAEIAVVT
jgi:hypothetical protein